MVTTDNAGDIQPNTPCSCKKKKKKNKKREKGLKLMRRIIKGSL